MPASERLTAAGGLLWRRRAERTEVLLVHRPGYDDWSLPKGKPDRGENPLQTAVREVTEETGLPFTVGPRLGRVTYRVKDRTKVVSYFSMRLDAGCAAVPAAADVEEVDEFAWLPTDKAMHALTYAGDRHILGNFAHFGTAEVSLILVRHGRAGSRSRWTGPDDLRPLDAKGARQAEAIGATLGAFGPQSLLAAAPTRCVQTAEPLGGATGLPIGRTPALADAVWESDPEASVAEATSLAQHGRRVVVVSQGKTMRGVLERLLPPRSMGYPTKKGGLWVLGALAGRIVTHDYYPSLLAG
ncbi:NUDIX hydrolase [Cumulibacter manganitolerans]|uniref:NUDIX hydrolase n=1 Tax=Cumulibacter manganitolerans TaxID=1884992 RepID=UPI001885E302|nr:NUDIX hydrolase [Cumulibacter manganitolerans]